MLVTTYTLLGAAVLFAIYGARAAVYGPRVTELLLRNEARGGACRAGFVKYAKLRLQ